MRKLLLIVSCLLCYGVASAMPINVVAAENFYGKLTEEIGGDNVHVTSIISDPNADPHLFTTSTEVSVALSHAQVIIYSGAGYDPWIDKLLKSVDSKHVVVINVADLVGIKTTDKTNPHIWYKPSTMPMLANALAKQLIMLNKQQKGVSNDQIKLADSQIKQNLQKFLQDNQKVQLAVKKVRAQCHGIPVTATEPVFGYMAEALGLKVKGLDVQWKIMNDTEPSPKMFANYKWLFTQHQINLLFYNQQVVDEMTLHILALAQNNQIPVVGITETLPPNMSINNWLLTDIENTRHALAKFCSN